eukprot:6913572-Ditylum_brightwellii.AAC.1
MLLVDAPLTLPQTPDLCFLVVCWAPLPVISSERPAFSRSKESGNILLGEGALVHECTAICTDSNQCCFDSADDVTRKSFR